MWRQIAKTFSVDYEKQVPESVISLWDIFMTPFYREEDEDEWLHERCDLIPKMTFLRIYGRKGCGQLMFFNSKKYFPQVNSVEIVRGDWHKISEKDFKSATLCDILKSQVPIIVIPEAASFLSRLQAFPSLAIRLSKKIASGKHLFVALFDDPSVKIFEGESHTLSFAWPVPSSSHISAFLGGLFESHNGVGVPSAEDLQYLGDRSGGASFYDTWVWWANLTRRTSISLAKETSLQMCKASLSQRGMEQVIPRAKLGHENKDMIMQQVCSNTRDLLSYHHKRKREK